MNDDEKASLMRVLATVKAEARKMRLGKMTDRIAPKPPMPPMAEGSPGEEAAESPMEAASEDPVTDQPISMPGDDAAPDAAGDMPETPSKEADELDAIRKLIAMV